MALRVFAHSYSTVAKIPGLYFFSNFLNRHVQRDLTTESLALSAKVRSLAEHASSYPSKAHNLSAEKNYGLVYFEDSPGHKINAQHFEDYGDTGHELTYFINNPNIPKFIGVHLIPRIEELKPVIGLGAPLNWRFTFNIYQARATIQPGFDWHTDLDVNGDITTITTLVSSALFEIRSKEGDVHSLLLTPGSTVVLSGEARWDWKHRIVPTEVDTDKTVGDISRISLVLGCRRRLPPSEKL